MSRSAAHGTCGELVQGRFDEHHFLITLPIDLWSVAEVAPLAGTGIRVTTVGREKSQRAASLLLDRLVRIGRWPPDTGLSLNIRSSIPVGKGMASSSADIVATCRAVAKLASIELAPWEISQVAAQVEPSDGVMYDHVVVFDFFTGTLLEDLGPPPALNLLVVDPGGVLKTTEFRRLDYRASEQVVVRRAYRLLRHALGTNDIEELGRATTLSAIINQRRHFKTHLRFLFDHRRMLGALGVVAAHSGVVLGLVYDPRDADRVQNAADFLTGRFPGVHVRQVRTTARLDLTPDLPVPLTLGR